MNNNKKYNIGLDIGIGSVGWAILDTDNVVIEKGVRLFNSGSTDDNQDRRKARGARRLMRRRRFRLDNFIKLAKRYNLFVGGNNFEETKKIFENILSRYTETLLIRNKAIKSEVSKEEVIVALYNILKHRGYTYLNAEDFEKTTNKDVIPCVEQLKFFKENNYYRGSNKVLPSTKKEDAINNNSNFSIYNYEKEVNLIFSANKNILNSDFQKEYIYKLKNIRKFWQGPGSKNSPTEFGLYQNVDGKIEKPFEKLYFKNIGKCSVFEEENRASKFSFSAELFNLLNDFNNIFFSTTNNKFSKIKPVKLSTEDKTILLLKVFKPGKSMSNINEKDIIKLFNINKNVDKDLLPNYKLGGFRIDPKGKFLITKLEGYKEIVKKLFDLKLIKINFDPLLETNTNFLNEMAFILSNFESVDERIEEIKNYWEEENKILFNNIEEIKSFSTLKWTSKTGTHSLSIKALETFNTPLLNSNENFAQLKSKFQSTSTRGKELKKYKYIPLNKDNKFINSYMDFMPYSVIISFKESIKVINALWKKYDINNNDNIVIELAREKNDKEKRETIKFLQGLNGDRNKIIKDLLEGIEKPSPTLRRKLFLYLQQNGIDIYSGKCLDINMIKNDNFYSEIDHIIPRSVHFDDSYNNTVLTLTGHNQSKGNQTPYAWVKSGTAPFKNWSAFKDSVKKTLESTNIGGKKAIKTKLDYLNFEEDITKYDVQLGFINRNLVDTRWTTKSILNLLKDFVSIKNYDIKVKNINGKMTNFVRKYLKIRKDRDVYSHHAFDASLIVFALTANKNVQHLVDDIETVDNNLVNNNTGEVLDYNSDTLFNSSQIIDFKNSLITTDTKFSFKKRIKRNINLTNATVYATKEINHKTYKMTKMNIYTEKLPNLEKYFGKNPKDKNNLLMLASKPQNTVAYNQLNEIFISTLEEIQADPKLKNKNPFTYFCEKNNLNYISRKNSKNLNNPIKNIKIKTSDEITPQKKLMSVNKTSFKESFGWLRVDIYQDNLGKIVPIRIDWTTARFPLSQEDPMATVNNKYRNLVENKKLLFIINRGDIFINNNTKEKFIISGYSERKDTNMIEIKYLNRKTEKRMSISFNTFMKEYSKVELDVLGKIVYKY